MRKIITILIALLLLVGCNAPKQKELPLLEASIIEEKAQREVEDSKLHSISQSSDNGIQLYELDVRTIDKKYILTYDGATGELLKKVEESLHDDDNNDDLTQ